VYFQSKEFRYFFLYDDFFFNRLQAQMFDLSDSTGLFVPLQGAAQLDMNVSCLFMHEVNILCSFFFSQSFKNFFHFS
jgi:hypothetical protein